MPDTGKSDPHGGFPAFGGSIRSVNWKEMSCILSSIFACDENAQSESALDFHATDGWIRSP